MMSTYFQRYAFKHPRPQDFFAVANEVSGQDLSWYFDQVYRGAQTFDYALDYARSDRVGDGGYHTMVVARRNSDGVFPVTVRVTFADGRQTDWSWDGRSQWKMFQIDGARGRESGGRSRRGAAAGSEPNEQQRWCSSPTHAPRPPAGRSTWLVWLQDQLLTYGFFV